MKLCEFVCVITIWTVLCSTLFSCSVLGLRQCPPLPGRKSTKNVVIKCHKDDGTPFDCGGSANPFPSDITVTFDCAPWFKSNQDLSSVSKREIHCSNGKWIGLKYFLAFTCSPECGKLPKFSKPFSASFEISVVSSGTRNVDITSFDRLPWEASIKSGNTNCKGTIIPSRVGNATAIITSKDCISTSINEISVTIDSQNFAAKAVKTSNEAENNLAILFLKRPIILRNTALPVCLPSDEDYGLTVGMSGVSGSPNVKVTVKECSQLFHIPISSQIVDRSQFCTEIEKNPENSHTSSCSAFGFGFYGMDNPLNPIYSVIGIQSKFLKYPNCDIGMIYTKLLDSHMDWITEVLDWELENPETEVENVSNQKHSMQEIEFHLNRGGCPPLKNDEMSGFEIQCNNGVDCLKKASPMNTVAKYSCKPHFMIHSGASSTATIQCRSNGPRLEWGPLHAGFSCQLDCGGGSEGSDIASFITEGYTSTKGKWPWVVAIYAETSLKSGQFEFICGGTLISQNIIVTAAHCLAIPGTTRPRRSESLIRLQFGKFRRGYEKNEPETQQREIRSIHIHPYYNHLTLDSDIAIAVLNKPLKITSHVHPVCLPTFESHLIENESTMGSLIGWGRLVDGIFPEELQEARIPFVPYKKCQNSHPTFGQLVRPSTNFCAGYQNFTGACDGDSGSGLYYRDPLRPRKWVLVGIVSGGVANWKGSCQPGHYSMFTKVTNFKDWISDTLLEINSDKR